MTGFFFLSPRCKRGEETEERSILTVRASSPRPSPPFDGGEGVSLAAATGFFFLSPRRRSGERAEERGVLI